MATLPTPDGMSLHALLHEISEDKDQPYTHALFLSFSTSLPFFESDILGLLRRAGVSTTVITDRRAYAPDARAVHAAGQHYAVGLPGNGQLFHPKVMLFTGPDQALAAVGSGNLTLSGWYLNTETLTVIQGSRTRGCAPELLDLARWLQQLPEKLGLGAYATSHVHRCAAQVQSLSSNDVPRRFTLLGNLERPIIGQLPREPVEELRLYSPFHEFSGNSFDELLQLSQSRLVRVAIDPSTTVIDPASLLARAQARGVAIRFEELTAQTRNDSGNRLLRYNHGKVIEAVDAGHVQWTLTGSPNVSTAALLRTAATGNCELAVLSRGPESLYPGGGRELAENQLVRREQGPGRFEEHLPAKDLDDLVTEVRLDGASLVIQFSHPLTHATQVQVSPLSDGPEEFLDADLLPPGCFTYDVSLRPEWGRRLRVRLVRDNHFGPTHFLIEPSRVASVPRADSTQTNDDLSPAEISNQFSVPEQWWRMVTKIAEANRKARPLSKVPSSGGGSRQHHYPGVTWADEIEAHTHEAHLIAEFGVSMAAYARAGLPSLSSLDLS